MNNLWKVMAAALIGALAACAPAGAATVFGITPSGNLVRFNSATPGTIDATLPISGLLNGESLVAIDFRPATGELFGLGRIAADQPYRLYSINPLSAEATEIGAFATALSGTDFCMDFDASVDLIRVNVNTRQNFRVRPSSGGTVDGDPNVAGTDPDTRLTFVSTDPNAAALVNVSGTACTNNFPGATAVTQFGIDSALNILVRIGSPDGSPDKPETGQVSTIGPLGVDVIGELGFDIVATGTAFAAMASTGDTASKLYTIDLATGAATAIGAIGTEILRGIAVAPSGSLQFSAAKVNTDEAGSGVDITVNRIAGTDGTITIDFATSDGTATAGADYTAVSGTLTFGPNETAKAFNIPILNDTLDDPDETINLTLSKPTGGAVIFQGSAVVTLQNVPVFTSFAVAGGEKGIAFSYTLATSGSKPVTFSAPGLPSGLVLDGDTIKGTPAASGDTTVQVTATNGAGSATQSLRIILAGDGVSKTLVETDGDGFPDEIEVPVGTSSTISALTPFAGAPAGAVQALTVTKMGLKLNFAKNLSDGLGIGGTLPIPGGFQVGGKQVVVDVGGVVKIFTLDSKGNSPKAVDSFKIKIKASKGVVAAQIAKFQMKFSKGTFASALTDEGLTNQEMRNQPRTVPVILLFNQKYYQKNQILLYSAKFTKSGSAKLLKGT